MPSTTPADQKSRQSSGGKSFFHKFKSGRASDDPSSLSSSDISLPISSYPGSASSRHAHRPSTGSSDRPYSSATSEYPASLTSMPYESMSRHTLQPAYDNKRDNSPNPNALASVDPNALPHHSFSHPTGPRPPPSRSGYNARTSSRNGAQASPFNGYPTSEYSRASSDQASLYSNTSPNRASSVVSGNASQISFNTMDPHASATPRPAPSSGHMQVSRPSQMTISTDPAIFSRPKDDRQIEQEFFDLMMRRGWNSMPEAARRQMEAYPIDKKWTLVYQDRLGDWKSEQTRRDQARSTIGHDGAHGLLDRAGEEGTPEWYVKRIMDGSITPKQLQSLSVSLRTQPIQWVRDFVEAQGQVALTNVLGKINKRQTQGPAPAQGSTSEKDLDREYDIVKCLKALMNSKFGADDALDHAPIVQAIAASLTSARLATRRLVSEVLTFLCHWNQGKGHMKVIHAFDQLKSTQNENGRFDSWIRVVEVTLDGRGKLGSMVGASDEVRSGGVGMENQLMEYAVATLIFINMLVDAPDKDLQLRCHIRAQLNSCGIKRVLQKMEDFQYEVIDKQVEHYRANEGIDYEDFMERDGGSTNEGVDGRPRDLSDPTQIVEAIAAKTQGSRAYDYFQSAMQHMLLIRDNEADDRMRLFQLVDSMMSYVAMDRRLPDMDLKQSLNFSVQGLLDKLYTDAEARMAREEALEARQIADAAISERDEMRYQLEIGSDGVVAKLQKQLEDQQAIINLQSRNVKNLKAEIAEEQRLRALDAQRNELETRELYLMMRDAQQIADAQAVQKGLPTEDANGILDRERLMERLEMQLERQKTQAKLEGKAWQQVGPSEKLRELRQQMDDEPSAAEEATPKVQGNTDHSFFGSVARNRADSRFQDGSVTGTETEADESEVEILETPRVVEMHRPPKPTEEQRGGLLSEIAAKVRRYDSDEDIDCEGDGVTTGPSHPSLESDAPHTPDITSETPKETADREAVTIPAGEDPVVKNVPPYGAPTPTPPSAPPMPGFSSAAPPPPPPPMPGFSNIMPPPPPPMPGFSGIAPPPPPPMPGMAGSGAPPAPPIPGAPPMPGQRAPYRTQQAQYGDVQQVGLGFARPKKKLKALHWEKVDSPAVTMWASHAPTNEAKEEKYIELSRRGILDEVEKLFMAKETKILGKGSAAKKNEKKMLISHDLSQNFQISLQKFTTVGVDDLVRMIIHCERDVLDNQVVMTFFQRHDLCEIPDNLSKLMAPYSKDWTGAHALQTEREQDPSELTREDQIYLYTAFELRHYWKSRIRALSLTRTFEKDYEEITAKLQEIVAVSLSLRDSVSFMNILGLILDIGNYMNDANKQATGFKLSSLARLAMIKDDKNETTFADLVERIVRNQYPAWEGFADDLAGVLAVQKVSVEQVRQDARNYIDTIDKVQMSLDSGNLSDPKKFHPEDRVSHVVQRAMKDARRKAEQMQVYLDEMIAEYESIMAFYGEDPSDENARRDFFGKIAGFIAQFKRSKETNVTLEEARRRNEESMRRKQQQAGNPFSQATGEKAPRDTGAMDSLLEKLRAAAPRDKDQRERRRRARLNDRHQVRKASGQRIEEISADDEQTDETGLLSPPPEDDEDKSTETQDQTPKGDEDIGDRAASLLQNLRGPEADGDLSMRRRRESADDEREARRRRRRQATSSTSSAGSAASHPSAGAEEPGVDVIPEEPLKEMDEDNGGQSQALSTVPTTIVSPPSPHIVAKEETNGE